MNFVVTGWGYSGDPDMLPPYAADLQMFNFLAITRVCCTIR